MPRQRRITLLPLICLIYLVVSGGPYGIEDAVGLAGPRLTLLLCVLVPITLSLPTALMAAELTALSPVEGGFYFWVKEALGPFAGFTEAYLTILYTAVDTAIYPVLFVTYLSAVWPMSAAAQVMLSIIVIWICGLLNAMGVRSVGYSSIVWTMALAAPFIALVAIGLPRLAHWEIPPESLPLHEIMRRVGTALTVIIWNFSGWENLSTVAAEIEAPQRTYLRALMIALPAVALGYLLPLAVCVQGAGKLAWHTGSFAAQGARIGGAFLGAAIAVGGAVASFGILEAAMLWVSRLPFVLARENYLPLSMATVWSGRGVPGPSILVCCVVFTLLIPLGFITLVVFDVFFYMMALALEMAALLRLRRQYPVREGLFIIGGGRVTLYLVALSPLLTWAATLGIVATHGANDLIIASALAFIGWPLYEFLRRRYGGPAEPSRFATAASS